MKKIVNWDKPTPNESGLCMCGCGKSTKLADKTSSREGILKGQHRKYLCGHKNRTLIKNHNNEVKEGQFYHSGYVYILAPDGHPNTTFKRYIKRSRLVMENSIGRNLTHGEQVHHINGIRDDDRIENLEILTLSEHNKKHKKAMKMVGKIKHKALEAWAGM